MTSPHLQLWRHEKISSVWSFSFNRDHVISILNFPVNDLCYDSIGNKLFGFIFSRSHEPIVIGVCGMRSADQDHRIVSEPITSGSFLESGPEHQQPWYWHPVLPLYSNLSTRSVNSMRLEQTWPLRLKYIYRKCALLKFIPTASIGCVSLAVITGTIILVPFLKVNSLQHI